MGFIFSLLLLCGLTSIFLNFSDKVKSFNREIISDKNNEIELFFSNLYVVTWQYYQQIELEAIKKIKERKPRYVSRLELETCFADELDRLTKVVYGTPIVEHCIEKAFNDLRERGYPLYYPNPNEHLRSQFGYDFVSLNPHQSYDIRPDLWLYKTKIKNPGEYYDWAAAKNIYGEFPKSCVPDILDPRTYFYYYPYAFPQLCIRNNMPEEILAVVADIRNLEIRLRA